MKGIAQKIMEGIALKLALFLSCLNDCKETFRQCLESSRGKRRILDPKP